MAQSATGTATRGRGRPPRLSREQIVEAAVGLLERDPDSDLTIKRVAEAAGAAPMALYRYFPDRDALLQAVADRVLSRIQPVTLTGETWQEQVRQWMRNSRERLRPHAQLLPYMASTQQPVGVRSLAKLAEVLRPLGLHDEDLAVAVLLISSTTIGYASYETRRSPTEQIVTQLQAGLSVRPESEREALAPLLPRMPAAFARLYDVVLDQTVAAIEALAPVGSAAER
ncbi:TetR/AcrR family transcriptional regulator [Streptomyces sp. NBC_00554]|uniref:TetR/AcrR family transcriptional regulator n=1 Tax=unclassified Streptomyces TaxID=2593676 RepID=UPI00352ED4BD|nr:TetR/AcrR family transcriptional regulator [Streptomyces sp. NBC_00564]WUC54223.1 TetR/AcrR family transcriptional regulator [Streptomyces sp. NBC_00554]